MALSNRLKSPATDEFLTETVAKIVSDITGVILGARQATMVETRLKKRMMDLGCENAADYLDYLEENKKSEISALVSLLTTHHTFFFREYSHFEYLAASGLAKVVAAVRARGERTLKVWSAACSRGQEVYSLAMFLKDHLPRVAPGFDFQIYGTDVDPESVGIATNGVYSRNEIKGVPLSYLGDHWSKGTGDIADFVKAKSSLRHHCNFETLNLLNCSSGLGPRKFDLIFCRNVFIYFPAPQIRSISQEILSRLNPEGLFFIGISESLNGMGLPVRVLGPSIYSLGAPETPKAPFVPNICPGPSLVVEHPPILRVLCVDDSPSVLKLLKQVLRRENGFEVVATASNGLEASRKLSEIKVDLVTLDIHMPDQDGVEYLRRNLRPDHPPVLMISSVAREDADLALQCLELGASDYVEKPELANLKQRGEEIRTKLLSAHRSRVTAGRSNFGRKANLSLDMAFGKKATGSSLDSKVRVIVFGPEDGEKMIRCLSEFTVKQPPTLLCVEDGIVLSPTFLTALERSLKKKTVSLSDSKVTFAPDIIYVGELKNALRKLPESAGRISVLVFGRVSKTGVNLVSSLKNTQVLVEDIPGVNRSELAKGVVDIVPATSFAYMSMEFLRKSDGGN